MSVLCYALYCVFMAHVMVNSLVSIVVWLSEKAKILYNVIKLKS